MPDLPANESYDEEILLSNTVSTSFAVCPVTANSASPIAQSRPIAQFRTLPGCAAGRPLCAPGDCAPDNPHYGVQRRGKLKARWLALLACLLGGWLPTLQAAPTCPGDAAISVLIKLLQKCAHSRPQSENLPLAPLGRPSCCVSYCCGGSPIG